MPPRKKTGVSLTADEKNTRSTRKRGHRELESIPENNSPTTPSKRRRNDPVKLIFTEAATESETQEQSAEDKESSLPVSENSPEAVEDTPKTTPRRRGRPPKVQNGGDTPTSKTKRITKFETPKKILTNINGLTPKRGLAADQSARRKSTKALIEHVVGDDVSDDEVEDNVARKIYDSSAEEEEEEEEEEIEGEGADGIAIDEAATPSKTPRRKGRPRKRAKSPTPPRDLPPHELYFAHNKPGRAKTSNNTLASLKLLTHEEYFSIINSHKDRHAEDIEYLESLHAESFPQWTFELSQGFGLCMYGFGSKRHLLHKFAKHLHARRNSKVDKIVMINGYAPTTTLREILSSIGTAVDPAHRIPVSQPAVMVQSISAQLAKQEMTLTLVVNSIDATALRKPGTHAILAQLAAHPQVQLVCSADTPDFHLIWDIGVRSAYNFLFHDCTTFAPFSVELDIVDQVHQLLGREARRVNGREGVAFVLRSLPENAKNLFRLIVGEILIAMEEEGGTDAESTGVEYRMVYNKAVEEFICSSEMAFRTLLKEFHDHQMITSRKDALGTELLSVPFRREELEAILEDLMS